MTITYKKSELLKLCKENNIKGVSKKRKNELIILLEQYNIFKKMDIKEEIIIKSDILPKENIFDIKELEEKVFDKKDPISLEPFQDWTEEELRTGIFMNGYYYKEDTIKNYISINNNKKEILDPINQSLKVPENIIRKYKIEKEEILKEEEIQFDYETRYIQFDYHMFLMTLIFLKIPKIENYKVETKLKYSQNRYCIGVIPNNISICSWTDYPFEIKALDTSSTTEALLIRITELYKNKRLIKIEEGKIKIKKIESLPHRSLAWFTFERGYYYLDTSPKENNRKTVYNSLLEELDSY